MLLRLTVLISLFAGPLWADEPADALDPVILRPAGSKVIPFGHNFSSTSYVLPKDECTVGLQVIGCGVSDDVALALSPWLFSSYNMANFFVRSRFDQTPKSESTIEAAYFKTFGSDRGGGADYDEFGQYHTYYGEKDYQMEAFWLRGIYGQRINDHFASHLNLNFQYYLDDRRPFSLRRPSMRHNRAQLNVTDLMETQLVGSFYLVGEIGVADLISNLPHLVVGSSLQWRALNWMAHMGFSMNGSADSLFVGDRFDAQRRLHDTVRSYDDTLPDDYEKKDYGIHPEFSLQYYF